jgi:hypothetical protein
MTDSPSREKAQRLSADFLRRRFGAAPGNLFCLIWTKKGAIKQSLWLSVSQLPEAEAILRPFSTPDAGDVYVGAALSPRDFGSHNRCEADAAAGITGLWADVDVKGETHKKTNLPSTLDEARALARSLGVLPTEEIHSGHGLQVYWEFATPWIFRGDADRQKAADLARHFQELLHAKAKAQGWQLDRTHDLARVLPLPGTWNHKTADPVPVRVLTSGGPRHEVGDFLALVPPDGPAGGAFSGRASDGVTVIKRARRYVAKMPAAIAGQRGHDATFAVVQVLVRGFSLTVDEAAADPGVQPPLRTALVRQGAGTQTHERRAG